MILFTTCTFTIYYYCYYYFPLRLVTDSYFHDQPQKKKQNITSIINSVTEKKNIITVNQMNYGLRS